MHFLLLYPYRSTKYQTLYMSTKHKKDQQFFLFKLFSLGSSIMPSSFQILKERGYSAYLLTIGKLNTPNNVNKNFGMNHN